MRAKRSSSDQDACSALEAAADRPDITVVVIVYNDSARLPRAVASVLAQTHRSVEILVVDDASTDGSGQVADELAAAHPERIRAIHLPENSGGCSRPRNVGMADARGEYLMLLDSDDELDQHACKSLFEAVSYAGADFAVGLTLRVHVKDRNRVTKWYPKLFNRYAVYDGLQAKPDMINDSLSTNKCYRKSFLLTNDLRFPGGLHYEDLAFTAQTYLACERFVVIPNAVYRWYVDDDAESASITNSRSSFRNLLDRLDALRLVDDAYLRQDAGLLKLEKDVKFLRHDLRLYINDLPDRDEQWQRRFLDVAQSYVATLDPAAPELAGLMHRVAVLMLESGDLQGLLTTVDFLANRGKVAERLVERKGRIFWGERHLDTEHGRTMLDVTGMGLQELPHWKFPFFHRITGIRVDDDTLHLSGTTLNQLGRLDGKVELALRLASRRKIGGAKFAPVSAIRRDGHMLHWTTAVQLGTVTRPWGFVDVEWDVGLRVVVRGSANISPLTVRPEQLTGMAVPVKPRLSRLAADHLRPRVTVNGNLAFSLVPLGAAGRRAHAAVAGARRSWLGKSFELTGRRSWRAARTVQSTRVKAEVYRRVLVRLPRRRGSVVFESHLGKQYSDSPKYIYEELRRRQVPLRATWSYAGSSAGFPPETELVRRGSWRYHLALARAEFWVDNQGFPAHITKPPGTIYVQTWHGSTVKHLGFDMPSVKRQSEAEHAALRAMIDRWDHLLIRSEHDVRAIAGAYRSRANLLRVGLPRNDVLVTERKPDLTGLRDQLGLDHRRVLLYAPTFRQIDGRHTPFRMPFDLVDFDRRFGAHYTLLVRTHYLDHVVIPAAVAGSVIDVGSVHDVSEVLLLSDALITDYSSLMFDYALLARPILLFTYDYDAYVGNERGTYFDLASEAPGPLLLTQQELFGALEDLDEVGRDYESAREEFAQRRGEYDRGDAASAVVDQVLMRQPT